MSGYIGYMRVSTVKQGTHGVSLHEQREGIERYASRNGLAISLWLEETVTAAKQGRPIFMQALRLLRTGKARGIILHKLDRGARNLKDWTAIGELSDQGIEVHFVTESLDLQSRGGRLSADIQAVVAADYIRNLREETRKGFYGRLKQGLYPMRAPVGYVDQGKGKEKTVHPVMGPLVRKAFELYETSTFNFERLEAELYRLGLRNRHGGRITRNGLSIILNNPFYYGLIKIQKTGESFVGIHEPLITKQSFDRVQAVLNGKVNARTKRHNHVFRRMLSCSECPLSLIGEKQKGQVYYRCHGRHPLKTGVREDLVRTEVRRFFGQFRVTKKEKQYFRAKWLVLRTNWENEKELLQRQFNLQLGQIADRLNRLTDAYLDNAIERPVFDERKKSLLLERDKVQDDLLRQRAASPDLLTIFLELSTKAWLSHKKAEADELREMLEISTSNRTVTGKKLYLEPSNGFREIADRHKLPAGDPKRDVPRTWDRILSVLTTLNLQGLLPDLSKFTGFSKHDVKVNPSDLNK